MAVFLVRRTFFLRLISVDLNTSLPWQMFAIDHSISRDEFTIIIQKLFYRNFPTDAFFCTIKTNKTNEKKKLMLNLGNHYHWLSQKIPAILSYLLCCQSERELATENKRKVCLTIYSTLKLALIQLETSTLNENETELKWNRCVFKFVKCRAIHHSFFRWNECQVQIQHGNVRTHCLTHDHIHIAQHLNDDGGSLTAL